MADITYSKRATQRRATPVGTVQGKGEAYRPFVHTSTTELAASTAGTTIHFGRFPSNARIALHSQVYWDDLASTGSPTLDIGIASVNSNVTSDPDALNDGLDLATAAASARIVKDVANVGKRLWEFVNGQTTDPGGELDVYGSVVDAATTATGTVSVEILAYMD